ncbi:MAG: carboxypeptidase regulatory-like domain-containing protein, partial [Deltaproteobacteria bacterium]|nr:carboxypeptidase regulatory-like domain-containing protein [Deltaproteobacteria bacterium]
TVRLERLDLPEPVGEALYISGTISGDVKAGVGIALVEDAGMTVIAGADGSFRLGPVGPGTYTVKPQLAGYRFSPRSRTVTLSGSGSGAVAFSMRRMGLFFFITGRVQGAVVSGIDISASGAKKAVTTTDSQGTFVLEDLPPGDYVLKPRMLGALFEPAEIALTLPVDDDAAPELSFRVKEMACAASQAAAQGSENLTKLRQLRDRVLSKSSSGRRYISLYYLASPEIVKLLRQNQSLRTEAAALLMAVLPAVDRLLNGQPADVPAVTHGRLTAFIENLSRTGSPVLQKIMQRFLADLRDKKFLESLTE